MPDRGFVEAARALVPVWVDAASVAVPACIAFLATYLCGLLLFLCARRVVRRSGAHWTERARAIHPSRHALAIVAYGAPFAAVWQAFTGRGPLAAPTWLYAIVVAAAAYLGGVVWRVRLERALGRPVTFRAWIRSLGVRWCVFWPHLAVALVVALGMPPAWGLEAALLLAAGSVAVVMAAAGGGYRVARRLGLLPPASERVERIARAAADRLGVELRDVHEPDLPEANAYALSQRRVILFTRALDDALDDAGVEGICFHELAHLTEPRGARMLRLSGLLVLLPLMAWRPLVAAGGILAFLGALVVVLLFSSWLRRRLRGLETRADEQATREQEHEGAYARALETLYRTNVVPASRAGPLHPDLYDRLVAAGVEPGYGKPEPPSGVRMRLAVGPGLLLAIALMMWPSYAAGALRDRPLWSTAMDGGDGWRAGAWAGELHAAGRNDEALTLLRAASELTAWWPGWAARAAVVHAARGEWDLAQRALDTAREQAADLGRPGPWDDDIAAAVRALSGRSRHAR